MPARFPDTNILPVISMEEEEMSKPDKGSGILDEIVISGISGKFPESENMEEFSQNLFNGVDMITDDGRRWEPGRDTMSSYLISSF